MFHSRAGQPVLSPPSLTHQSRRSPLSHCCVWCDGGEDRNRMLYFFYPFLIFTEAEELPYGAHPLDGALRARAYNSCSEREPLARRLAVSRAPVNAQGESSDVYCVGRTPGHLHLGRPQATQELTDGLFSRVQCLQAHRAALPLETPAELGRTLGLAKAVGSGADSRISFTVCHRSPFSQRRAPSARRSRMASKSGASS